MHMHLHKTHQPKHAQAHVHAKAHIHAQPQCAQEADLKLVRSQ